MSVEGVRSTQFSEARTAFNNDHVRQMDTTVQYVNYQNVLSDVSLLEISASALA